MSAEAIVIDMRRAVRTQHWEDALVLAEIGRRTELADNDRIEMLAGEASALRRTGRIPAARDVYLELDGLLHREDIRRAEIMIGLAECYLVAGIPAVAAELSAGAAMRSEAGTARWARAGRINVLALAREDLAGAEAQANLLLNAAPAGSSRAPIALVRGEVLLRMGRLDDAAQALIVARAEATATGATRTLADVVRREATLAIARADTAQYFPLLGQLQSLERAYAQAGDRHEHEFAIVRASLLTHLGRLQQAVTDLRRAYWQAHERSDPINAAHALLALADAQRAGGGDPQVAREQAATIYDTFLYAWGQFWSAALMDDPLGASQRTVAVREESGRALGLMEAACDAARLPQTPLPLIFP